MSITEGESRCSASVISAHRYTAQQLPPPDALIAQVAETNDFQSVLPLGSAGRTHPMQRLDGASRPLPCGPPRRCPTVPRARPASARMATSVRRPHARPHVRLDARTERVRTL